MKGYYYDKGSKRYRVRITYFGRRIEIGTFKTAWEAQIAYNDAQVRFFGADARKVYVTKQLEPQ